MGFLWFLRLRVSGLGPAGFKLHVMASGFMALGLKSSGFMVLGLKWPVGVGFTVLGVFAVYGS